MTNRLTQQVASLALAAFTTFGMLSSITLIASHAHQDTNARWESPAQTTQVVVISGKRDARS